MNRFKLYFYLVLACVSLTTASFVVADKASTLNSLAKQAGGYSNVSNPQLSELLKDDVVIVDIRREEEWRYTGIIPKSKTITFFDRNGQVNPNFVPEFTKLVKKVQPVLLICHSGVRTKVASQAIAQQLGYTKVINVKSGISAWLREKRPTIKYQKVDDKN